MSQRGRRRPQRAFGFLRTTSPYGMPTGLDERRSDRWRWVGSVGGGEALRTAGAVSNAGLKGFLSFTDSEKASVSLQIRRWVRNL
jgi:hypothetical protein